MTGDTPGWRTGAEPAGRRHLVPWRARPGRRELRRSVRRRDRCDRSEWCRQDDAVQLHRRDLPARGRDRPLRRLHRSAARAPARERGIARTFQTPALLDHSSVWDNVMLGASAWARSGIAAVRSPAGARGRRSPRPEPPRGRRSWPRSREPRAATGRIARTRGSSTGRGGPRAGLAPTTAHAGRACCRPQRVRGRRTPRPRRRVRGADRDDMRARRARCRRSSCGHLAGSPCSTRVDFSPRAPRPRSRRTRRSWRHTSARKWR